MLVLWVIFTVLNSMCKDLNGVLIYILTFPLLVIFNGTCVSFFFFFLFFFLHFYLHRLFLFLLLLLEIQPFQT